MNQSEGTNQNAKQPEVENCRVSRKGEGIEVCMMNRSCIYELPFGNLCAHPLSAQMTDIGRNFK